MVAGESEWIFVGGYIDPPDTPAGYRVEVKRCGWLGIVTHYRHVKEKL